MKLKDLARVNTLVADRRDFVNIQIAARSQRILSISGFNIPSDDSDNLNAILVDMMEARIRHVEAKILSLGVTVEGES